MAGVDRADVTDGTEPRYRVAELGPDEPAVLLAPRLAQFAAVARLEHVTRAAALLGVPQPTLSRAVARLEEELGVDLLARQGRAVRLTRAGRLLLASVERALAEVERGAEAARAEADPAAGRVAFGFLHTMGTDAVRRCCAGSGRGIRRSGSSWCRTTSGRCWSGCGRGSWTSAWSRRCRTIRPSRPARWTSSGCTWSSRRTTGWRAGGGSDWRRWPRSRSSGWSRGTGCARSRTASARRPGSCRGWPSRGGGGDAARAGRGRAGGGAAAAGAGAAAGVVELEVTAPRTRRAIGLAWAAGRPLTPPVAAFRDFVLSRRGRLLQHD